MILEKSIVDVQLAAPLNILFLTQYFPPETTAGANRVYELAKQWVRQGQQAQVLTGFPNHPDGVIPAAYQGHALLREDFEGISVIRTFTYATKNQGKVRRSLQYLIFLLATVLQGASSVKRCDVVIATSPHLLVAVAGAILSLILRKPFVMEVRDIWPEAVLAVGAMKRGGVIRILEGIEKALYRHAKMVVVVTEGFAAKLVAKGVPAEKITYLPNGIDVDRFSELIERESVKQRYGFKNKFLVSYIGNHGMAQNLSTILEIADRFREQADMQFMLAGDGAELAKIREKAAEMKLANVAILGPQPREAVPELLGMSDVCLVPLRKTSLFNATVPSKIYEILAAGVPLLISVDGDARRLVERSGGGLFVEPEDVDQYESAIRQLYSSEALRISMAKQGQAFVRAEFDRASLATTYVNALRSLVSNKVSVV